MSIGTLKSAPIRVDRTRDLQIFSLTLSQLSYPRLHFSSFHLLDYISLF
jgi:hypothetical protein